MQQAPFLDVRQGAFRKLAIELTRYDVHRRLKITVDGMKMRRSMISIVHGNYDTKKSTEFRHLPNYTADAPRFRLSNG